MAMDRAGPEGRFSQQGQEKLAGIRAGPCGGERGPERPQKENPMNRILMTLALTAAATFTTPALAFDDRELDEEDEDCHDEDM